MCVEATRRCVSAHESQALLGGADLDGLAPGDADGVGFDAIAEGDGRRDPRLRVVTVAYLALAAELREEAPLPAPAPVISNLETLAADALDGSRCVDSLSSPQLNRGMLPLRPLWATVLVR